MESIFINVGLLAGVALGALPIIMHLFMRPTPKKIIFPALQLVRERHKRAKRSLKIKNWLLLIARIALLVLMALALARPRFYSAVPLGDENIPKAIAFVIDTSLSMQFTEKGKDRLAEAKERAIDVLARASDTSQVFVIDSADPGVPVALSPAGARKQLNALNLRPANRQLNTSVGLGYTAVLASDRLRKEVYVLTDLTASAWDLAHPVEGLEKTKDAKTPVSTFVLRLAPKDLKDVAIVEAASSAGDSTEVQVKVRNQGPKTTRVVEFKLDGQVRDKKTLDLPEDSEVPVKFNTPRLDPGLHRAEIHLSGGTDPMEFNDLRVLTFQVAASAKVLILSDLDEDGDFIATALDADPSAAVADPTRPFLVDRGRVTELTNKTAEGLRSYATIFLNNVARLSDADWQKLGAYVREGGGVVIGLGNRVQIDSYNSDTAAAILPGRLDKVITFKEPTTFGQITVDHSLFTRYTKDLATDLGGVPVFKAWGVTPGPATRSVVTLTEGGPGLLERTFKGTKTGRVLLWTTPLSRRGQGDDPAAWNELPLFFSFWYLVKQTVPYLSGIEGAKLNYDAGEDVILPLDPSRRLTNYVVQGPDQKTADRQSPSATTTTLILSAPPQLGQWNVTGSGLNGATATLGFSVNAPESESRLRLLKTEELDQLFGKDNYGLAETTEGLKGEIDKKVYGRELFPWVMLLILILLTAENLLANKFHRETGPRPSVA